MGYLVARPGRCKKAPARGRRGASFARPPGVRHTCWTLRIGRPLPDLLRKVLLSECIAAPGEDECCLSLCSGCP